MADPDDEELPDDEIDEEGQEVEPGLVDDEGGDEAEARQKSEDAEGEEGQVAPKQDRRTRAVQEAKRVAREATEKTTALEREVAQLRAERQKEASRGETPQEEAARLALMTVEERVDYKLNKAAENHRRELAAVQMSSADAADRASYQAKASLDPRFKRYETEVEQVLAATRRDNPQLGYSIGREEVLQYVIGKRVLANQTKVAAQRKAGAANIARQRTAPDASRSDRSTQRRGGTSGNSLADLEKRLEGVEI